MKMEFETEDCAHCPCLRNDKYGQFYCFFERYYEIFDLNKVDDICPIKKEETTP